MDGRDDDGSGEGTTGERPGGGESEAADGGAESRRESGGTADAGADTTAGGDEATPDDGGRDAAGGGADGREWKFSIDEVGPEAGGDEPTVEPEPIDVEHAVLVALGAALALALVLEPIL